MARCYDPADISYHNYGGRGIKVSEEWHDFQNFLRDMGTRPDGTTLDRTDNDGDYSKDNCRWASKSEQSRNKRTNVVLTYKGKDYIMTDLADLHGIKVATLWARLNVSGMSV